MPKSDDYSGELAFLRGGGATAALIAEHDWTTTSLGPPSTWPQHLKTATAMLLRAATPMLLLWGEDGTVIYNDAYVVVAGARHPRLLGCKAHEAWPEHVDFNAHVIRTVLAGGSLEFRDQKVTLHGSGKPVMRWFDLDYSPVPDERGYPAGVFGVVVETTERVLAERKAAAHNRRQQLMFEQAPGFIALLRGTDYVYEYVNESYKRLFGERVEVGRSVREVFAELPAFFKIYDHSYATGERYVARASPMRFKTDPDGAEREVYADFVLQPVIGEDGDVTGIFVEGFEVTEQVRAQAAAQESEQRLSAAIAIARLGTIQWNPGGREATLDDRAREIFGVGPNENPTRDELDACILRDDFERLTAENISHSAAGRTRRDFECRIRRPDGSIRTITVICDSIPGSDGRPKRIVGVVDDVTERRRGESRQRLLIKELNHRVKNTLATVQSIAAQTLRSAPDLVSARNAFEARLVALAAAHDLLTSQSWRGARLADVVAYAMAPFETVQRPQISRSGQGLWLTAPRALALSLALHELATNAAKYGALSVPEGRVTIGWGQTASGELTLSWIENGGPAVAFPSRTGFGSRLLQRSLAHELGGEVDLTFAPEGVRCEIRCRIEDVGAEPLELLEA